MRVLSRLHFVLFVLTGVLTSQTGSAQSPPPVEVLTQARDRERRAKDDAEAMVLEADRACREAMAAAGEAPRGATTPTAARAQALIAAVKQKLCEEMRSSATQAQDEFRTAQRFVAALMPDPKRDEVPAVAGVGLLHDLVAAASKVDEQLEALRKDAGPVYDLVDSATSAALTLQDPKDSPFVAEAGALQDQAKAAREASQKAQSAANAFMRWVLQIKGCLMTSPDTCVVTQAEAYQKAIAARSSMEDHIRVGKAKIKLVQDATAKVVIAGKWDANQRPAAMAFAKMLEKYPNAAAPFSKDGFILVASGKDKLASIKLGADRLLPNGWKNWAVQFSTPLSDTGPSRVFSFSDGMIGIPSIAISRTNLELGKAFDSASWLSSWAYELKAGYSNRTYYENGPALPKDPTKKRVSPWEASVAYVAHATDSNNSHLVRLAYQRRVDDNPSQTRCPVGGTGDFSYVGCTTGSFGPPKTKEGAIAAYQFRYQSGDFATSPTLTYNERTQVVGFGLPLFLLREDNGKKNPFNAGIRADWVSKGKFEITGSKESTWTFGVFIGSSFNLLSRQE